MEKMMQPIFGSNTYVLCMFLKSKHDMQACAYGATKCMDRESDVTG